MGPVTDVARRYGVARQTVHHWLRRYGSHGLTGLADPTSRPASCPHQMPPDVEAKIVELRLAHPGWGPATVRYELARRARPRSRGAALYTGPWCAMASLKRKNVSGAGLITVASNA